MVKKKYFILYCDARAAFDELSDDAAGALIKAAFAFHDGEDVSIPAEARPVLAILKSQFKRNEEEYQNRCAQNRENIRKRWNCDIPSDTAEYDRIRNIPPDTKHTNRNKNRKKNIKESILANTKENALLFSLPSESSESPEERIPASALNPSRVNWKRWTPEQFLRTVGEYAGRYRQTLLDDFTAYWLEPTARGKPRFTAEKAWDTARRLQTWVARNRNSDSGGAAITADEEWEKIKKCGNH